MLVVSSNAHNEEESMSLVSQVAAVCVVLAAVGCDHESLTDLSSPHNLSVRDQAAFAATVSGSAVTAAAVSTAEIDLAWQQPSSPTASGFQIVRSTTGPSGPYSQIASVAAS